MASEEDLRQARMAHARNELGDDRSAWWPNTFRPTPEDERRRADLLEQIHAESFDGFVEEPELGEDDPVYPLWGRLMGKRGPFLVIQTPHGRAQAYFSKDVQKEGGLKGTLKRADLGDHVYVEGRRMRTLKGDKALACRVLRHVSKALLPPPEKWHGLRDVEKRYRERYVDLFANPEVATVFRARSRIVQALRGFLDDRGFLEVETPLLHMVRGGATAKPFETHHNALDMDLYLRVAPELYLKRLLVGGFERVYELGRTFRNEGISTRHNPEFTILEFYQAYATYEELMDLTEALFREVDRSVLERWPHFAEGRSWILPEGRFPRVPMRQAILERLARSGRDGVEPTPWQETIHEATLGDPDALAAACERTREHLSPVEQKQLDDCAGYGERVFLLYELLAEPELTRLYRTEDGSRSLPVFLIEFPFEVSPLSRARDDDPTWVDRFELFVDGREVVNAFSELNDPIDQAQRFEMQVQNRARGDEEAMDYDADYIRALEHGMPPAAGWGLGVDRLTMLLCGQPSIRDVLLFPLLKPEAG